MFFSFLLNTDIPLISDSMLYHSCGIILFGMGLFSSFIYLKIIFTPLKPNITIEKTPTEKYIEKYQDKFHASYKDDKFNQNIHHIFYDKKLYNQIIETNNNSLEKLWKQRILSETTPFGNVVMFYDAYKLSFAYYSDNSIPYTILNTVAMRYVITFYCRDFFLDKSIIPFGYTTPFLHVHEIEKKDDSKNTKKIDVNKGPFAKFKNYTKDEKKDTKTTDKKSDDKPPVKNYIKNKFISLGKLYNFSILKNTRNNNISTRKEIIPINYDSFKKWHRSAQFKMVTDKDYEEDAFAS
jgi:hypothetical protein